MYKHELMEFALHGVRDEIEKKCSFIAETWASPNDIENLKELIRQYDEIKQLFDEAVKEHYAEEETA